MSENLLSGFVGWKERLLDCLPARVRRHLFPEPGALHVDIEEGAAVVYRQIDGQRHELGVLSLQDEGVGNLVWETLSRGKDPLILHLPPRWLLRKRISLPAAAAENLRQVIGFEMDRLTPFTADQVYFDYRIEPTDGADKLIVDVALLPRKRVAPWLELFAQRGVRSSSLSSSDLWPRANLLPLEQRPGISIPRLLFSILPYLLFLLLLAASLLIPLWQQRNVLLDLRTKESALKKQAVEVMRIRDALEQSELRMKSMLQAKRQAVPVLEVLRVLTEILPDDTWVQQLDFKDDRVEIRGLSEQSSLLLKLLQESGGFEDVTFMSSVVQQRGKERFHLSAGIVHPFPRGITGIRLPEKKPAGQPGKGKGAKQKPGAGGRPKPHPKGTASGQGSEPLPGGQRPGGKS